LAIANTDGSGSLTLDVGALDVAGAQFRPPDGWEILFIGTHGPGYGHLHAIGPDGSGLRTLVAPGGSHYIGEAAYSPDGSRIAEYTWWDDPRFTVRTHIVSADGSGDRLLDPAGSGAWDGGVKWSNDGTRLAIVRGYDASGYGVTRAAIVPVDESSAGVETDSSVIVSAECCPAFQWAPDDSAILWTPTDAGGQFTQQLLIDAATGRSRPAPWPATTEPAWQRVAR
jgi:hypothetical protein